ncbi:401_t:CDS:1, partial [Acaulospora colombiana]
MTSLDIHVEFPSWSWMGWIGEAWISVGDDRWEVGETPEIVCHVHYNNPPRVVKVVDTAIPGHLNQPQRIQRITELQRSWKQIHDLAVSVDDISVHLNDVYRRLQDIPEEHAIFFWASSAVFTLEAVPSQGNRNEGPRILDTLGKQVGNMGIMKREYLNSRGYDSGKHELIVIGSRRISGSSPVLAVLQIEKRDEIAYRINIGEIDEEA